MSEDKPYPVAAAAYPLYVMANVPIMVRAPILRRDGKFFVETTVIDKEIVGVVTNRNPEMSDEVPFPEDSYEVTFRHPQGLVAVVVRKDALRHVADMPDLRAEAIAVPPASAQGNLDVGKKKPAPEEPTAIGVGRTVKLKEATQKFNFPPHGKIRITTTMRGEVISVEGDVCKARFIFADTPVEIERKADAFEVVPQRPA